MAAKSSARGWWIVAVVLAVTVAVAAVAVIATTGGSSSAGAVTLEPAANAGADPFTDSVQIGPAAQFPGTVQATVVAARNALPVDPHIHVRVATATAPGLYGGSGDKHVCKSEQLVAFLGQHPDKAAAWAAVLGIAPANIASYVASLTPVVLTSDTLVTNHGFRNGRATALQSVLQAGTAVMVDRTGTPRVKCNCGNPLTPPALVNPTRYRGSRWPEYSPTEVTIIKSGPTTINNITVINITTGATYTQTTGSGGSDGLFVAASLQQSSTIISSSRDGSAWTTTATLAGNVGGLTWGNNTWIAFGQTQSSSGTNVMASTDLRTWKSVGTVPAFLDDAVYAKGRFIAVGVEPDNNIGHGVVFSSTDGVAWTRVAAVNAAELGSIAFGNDTWIAVDAGHQGGDPSRTFRSTDGTTWTLQDDKDLARQEAGRIAFGSGTWALGGALIGTNFEGNSGVVSTSTDGTRWTEGPAAQFAGTPVHGVAYGNGKWLTVAGAVASFAPPATVFSGTDATTWKQTGTIATGASDLAFGGGGSSGTATPPPASTPTTVALTASSLNGIDWKNYTYTDQVCDTHGPMKFTNGTWTKPGTTGQFGGCGMHFTAVDYSDVTGDGVPDAIVNLHGSASGTIEGESDWTTVFTAGPNGPKNLGYIYGASFPPFSATAGLVVWYPELGSGSQGMCCPTEAGKDTYTYSSTSGGFSKTGTANVSINEMPKR